MFEKMRIRFELERVSGECRMKARSATMKEQSEKHFCPTPTSRASQTRRVKLSNPRFQIAYDKLERDLRNVKKMSREEALKWIEHVVPSS